MATALMTTLFAALMPLFAGIRHSATVRWAGLEMVQNARVLNEQLCRDLTGARRIVAVSAPTEDRGSLEFEAQDGVVYRYTLGPQGGLERGPAGDLAELAGPVEYLRFLCYNDTDFETPVQTPGAIRLVTWEVGFRSAEPSVPGRSVAGACCLRLGL